MSVRGRLVRYAWLTVAAVAITSAPAEAQGKSKQRQTEPAVSIDAAITATKDVLVRQGFEIVRIEIEHDRHIVYYRAGNQGRGKGQGPPVRLVVRRVEERIVLEDAPDSLRLEIGIKLGITL